MERAASGTLLSPITTIAKGVSEQPGLVHVWFHQPKFHLRCVLYQPAPMSRSQFGVLVPCSLPGAHNWFFAHQIAAEVRLDNIIAGKSYFCWTMVPETRLALGVWPAGTGVHPFRSVTDQYLRRSGHVCRDNGCRGWHTPYLQHVFTWPIPHTFFDDDVGT